MQDASKSKTETTPTQMSGKTSTYTIKVRDFIILAEYIVGSNKPTVKVPELFRQSLDRAISLRSKRFALSQTEKNLNESETLTDSDQTHAHFLGILEHIREILKPRMPSTDATKKLTDEITAGTETGHKDQIHNMFSNLEIQDPSREFLDAPDLDPSVKKDIETGPRYQAQRSQSIEEEYLALHCLFQDVFGVRSFIRQVWQRYLGGMDLAATAVTVNTAINFVRDLEQDFQTQFPGKTDYESMARLFFIAQCVNRGQDPGFKERPGDLFNFKVYDLVAGVMMNTFTTVSSLQDVLQPGIVPVYKSGHFGYRDKSTAWSEKSPRAKFHDDQLTLFEAFPDLVTLSRVRGFSPPSEDELIRGVRDMKPGADIPLWLVFAFQCFLDAQHELGSHLDLAHRQLKQTTGLIYSAISKVQDFHQSLRIENWPKQNDKAFDGILREIESWVQKDSVADALQKVKDFFQKPLRD